MPRTRRRGSPKPARRDRPVPIGLRTVGPICTEPTLPALSLAAMRVPSRAGRRRRLTPLARRPQHVAAHAPPYPSHAAPHAVPWS
jgi:hypothetical protein